MTLSNRSTANNLVENAATKESGNKRGTTQLSGITLGGTHTALIKRVQHTSAWSPYTHGARNVSDSPSTISSHARLRQRCSLS